MPRVHFVAKARKENSAAKVGEPYYWWKFRYGGRRVSKTRPRASQLTQSKMSGVYAAQEMVEDIAMPSASDFETKADLAEALSNVASVWDEAIQMVRDAAEEYRDSATNMEEYFPNGSSKIDELNEKADQLESDADEAEALKDEIESAGSDIEDYDDDGWQDEAQSLIDGLATAFEINE